MKLPKLPQPQDKTPWVDHHEAIARERAAVNLRYTHREHQARATAAACFFLFILGIISFGVSLNRKHHAEQEAAAKKKPVRLLTQAPFAYPLISGTAYIIHEKR